MVAAEKLIGIGGIDMSDPVEAVTCCHLLLGAHEIVFANGARTELQLLGPMAVGTPGTGAQAELPDQFPDLIHGVA